MIIYKITNTINNRIYIGQTVKTLQARWRSHCFSKNTYIGRAIRAYGRDSFKKEIIETVNSLGELNVRECYWIEFHDSTNKEIGYNLTSGGERPCYTDESIKKMSASAKKRVMKPFTQEHKDNISKSNKGRKSKPCTPERKAHLSRMNTGKIKIIHPDTGAKISKAKKGVRFSEAHKKALSEAWLERKKKNPKEFKLKYLEVGIKACASCKVDKSIVDFFRKRKNEEARESYCKSCVYIQKQKGKK